MSKTFLTDSDEKFWGMVDENLECFFIGPNDSESPDGLYDVYDGDHDAYYEAIIAFLPEYVKRGLSRPKMAALKLIEATFQSARYIHDDREEFLQTVTPLFLAAQRITFRQVFELSCFYPVEVPNIKDWVEKNEDLYAEMEGVSFLVNHPPLSRVFVNDSDDAALGQAVEAMRMYDSIEW